MKYITIYMNFLFIISFVYSKNINNNQLKCVDVIGFDDSICYGYTEQPKKLCGLSTINITNICYDNRLEGYKRTCPKANLDKKEFCSKDYYCGAGKECKNDKDCIKEKDNDIDYQSRRIKRCYSDCLRCFDRDYCDYLVDLENVAPENSNEECSSSLSKNNQKSLLLYLLFISLLCINLLSY